MAAVHAQDITEDDLLDIGTEDDISLPDGMVDDTAEDDPFHADFQRHLGEYNDGAFADARQGWLQLSESGHGASTHNAAVLLWRGQGGAHEPARALTLFQDAAAAEIPHAIHALGVLHVRGLGVEKDPVLGGRILRRGIKSGACAVDIQSGHCLFEGCRRRRRQRAGAGIYGSSRRG